MREGVPRNQYEQSERGRTTEERMKDLRRDSERRFQVSLRRIEESKDFPGSAIVIAERDGKKVGFAIRRTPEGQLQGE